MIKIWRISILIVLSLILFSCHKNPLDVDVSDVDVDMEFLRLDQDVFAQGTDIDQEYIDFLASKYSTFFDLYSIHIVRLGPKESPDYIEHLKMFINDSSVVSKVQYQSQLVFPESCNLEQQFENAMKHYRYHFPEAHIPTVVTMISGANQSVVVDKNYLAVSLDKYLGSDVDLYDQMAFPNYQQKNMTPERVVVEAMSSWAITEFPFNERRNNLLSNIVYKGQILYFLDAMLPELSDSTKIGFSQDQLNWCIANESNMWAYLAEKKFLYSNNRLDIRRFIGDGPFTSVFSKQSPARAAEWIGWRIVRSYMETHPDVTVEQLIQMSDYQLILNSSGYQP